MSFRELVVKSRTRRRFHENARISASVLRDLVDLGRLASSAGNLQPLKYIISNEPKRNALIFPHLAWAGYLQDWPGPAAGERPAAYIVMLGDTAITRSFGCDHGIAAQNIMLGVTELGLGGCIIGSVERTKLRQALEIPKQYEILLVLALGKPKETVSLEAVTSNDVKYWRDAKGGHHVPKRSIGEILLH